MVIILPKLTIMLTIRVIGIYIHVVGKGIREIAHMKSKTNLIIEICVILPILGVDLTSLINHIVLIKTMIMANEIRIVIGEIQYKYCNPQLVNQENCI